MERNVNRNEIITTNEERVATPLDDYVFPAGEGAFVGVLKYRAWRPNSKSGCLWCFFDAEDGNKYRMAAWANINYMPKKSSVSFADDVQNNTRWHCTFTKTKNGSTTWLTANLINSSDIKL